MDILNELWLAVVAAGLSAITFMLRWAVNLWVTNQDKLTAIADDRLKRDALEAALGRAAGQIVHAVITDPSVQAQGAAAIDRLVQRGADYVIGSMPRFLEDLGVPHDRVPQMLRGTVGPALIEIRALWDHTVIAPGEGPAVAAIGASKASLQIPTSVR
jgi:hypothetical protein